MTMINTFNTVLAMCQMMLKQKATESGRFLQISDIVAVVDEVTSMSSFTSMDKAQLVSELETRFTVVTAEHLVLGGNDYHKAWLPLRRADITWKYWDRYLLYLEERIARSAVDSVDSVTNDIMERIEDPIRPGGWDRRGLIMGHVQSGKTANYCGLACKAADVGYKVIIVLAGVHDSLRSQTQIRVEEGLLGFMNDTFDKTQTFQPIGVGLIDSSIRANTGTNRAQKGDFSRKVANQFGIHPGGLPLVFVVKKNPSVLDNLIGWIRSCADAEDGDTGRRYVRAVPALIIDDEADLASVDTRLQVFDEDGAPDENHDPTKTNEQIRLLLRSFERVAYVGYTATPFANIYIHDKGRTPKLGDDIFPRSFIVNIPAPSNYMGPARVFGIVEDEDLGLEPVPALPIVRTVIDHAASEKIDETQGWMPPKLVNKTAHVPRYNGARQIPPSLREAVMCFIVATAVRKLREPSPLFNSMLIHVVRYTLVQKEVATQVELALKDIVQRLRYGDGERRPTILEEFAELWEREFVPTTSMSNTILQTPLALPEWDVVGAVLPDTAAGIRVRIINGTAGDVLDYEERRATGMDIIAVGGDKLSRGLTLEGLSVSYFLRASRMYDTLMQMGRWFGYREKYIDVCRLYTTAELLEWFTHIASASEELQREFEHMVNVGGTPKDYGLKVRSHPAMLVTSAVKMRHGTEMRLSYSGDISETIIFDRNETWLKSNWRTVEDWLLTLGVPEGTKARGYTFTCKADNVLEFLGKYLSHEDARRADTKILQKYIRAQLKNEELVDWTVRLVSSSLSDANEVDLANLKIGLIQRALFPKEQRAGRYTIRRLVSPADEIVDLSTDEQQAALELTIQNWKTSRRQPKTNEPPKRAGGREIRQTRKKSRALLLVYPLDPEPAGLPASTPAVIGVAISFPNSETAREITYTVNNVFTSRGGDDDSL